jgi:hypothetical protein
VCGLSLFRRGSERCRPITTRSANVELQRIPRHAGSTKTDTDSRNAQPTTHEQVSIDRQTGSLPLRRWEPTTNQKWTDELDLRTFRRFGKSARSDARGGLTFDGLTGWETGETGKRGYGRRMHGKTRKLYFLLFLFTFDHRILTVLGGYRIWTKNKEPGH